MKDFFKNVIGGVVGGILWFIIYSLICFIPLAAIGASFWLNLLLVSIIYFLPSTSAIFWIWGLVCVIQGPQGILAIVYYVLFAILFLPYFISTFFDLLGRIFGR